MKTDDKEFDELMELVNHRTESTLRALRPIIDQLMLVDIKRQRMPYGLPDSDVRFKEMDAIELYLKNMVDQVLGVGNPRLKI
jgi:hypothetical protein